MRSKKKWSKDVSEHSDALDLKQGVFKLNDPKRIASSLRDSAEHSERRKSNPFRSAMSMLTFYINRAGPQVSAAQHKRLEKAKDELRELYDRPRAANSSKPTGRTSRTGSSAGESGSKSAKASSGMKTASRKQQAHRSAREKKS